MIGADVQAPLRARALLAAGQLAHYQGDAELAVTLLEQSLALYQELDDLCGTGIALLVLGAAATDGGEYDAAEALLADARMRFEEVRDDCYSTLTVCHLGVVALGQGDLNLARERVEEALRRARASGHSFNAGMALQHLALLACERGDLAGAGPLLTEALALDREMADREGLVRDLASAAVLAGLTGRFETAAHLFGAAEAARVRIGLLPYALPERHVYERALSEARLRLGEAAYTAAWAAGSGLSEDEAVAVAEALSIDPVPASRLNTPPHPSMGLTVRDLDVLALLVEGRSNREIAEALFVSPRTVDNHVTNILAKLEVKSRTAAVAVGRRVGLAKSLRP